MVYNMFAGVINAFLKEQVGPTVEVSFTTPNSTNYDLGVYMTN